MTLTYELDLDIVKCTCIPKMKFLGQGFQMLEHEQDRQTDTHTHIHTDAIECITAATFVDGNKLPE